jgi:hypothetical protein
MAIDTEPVRGGAASSRSPRRLRRTIAGLLAATLVVVPLIGLGLNGWSLNRLLNTCMGQEAEDFPDLEQVASNALEGTDYRLSRFSGCEYQGIRDPQVRAVLLDWRLRGPAVNQLTTQGWTQVGGPLTPFRSPTGEYFARVTSMTEQGATHAWVSFCLAGIRRCEPSSD